jgi:hypothetical protein
MFIVPVRVQDSWCMGLELVSWDLSIPSGVRLVAVLLVVVWPVASNMPIYDCFLDMYLFCMLHVSYIYEIQDIVIFKVSIIELFWSV